MIGNDFVMDKFHDASPINIEHPWNWFFLISISSLPVRAGITMQPEKPINHHVKYINWPIKNQKNAAWEIYVLHPWQPLRFQISSWSNLCVLWEVRTSWKRQMSETICCITAPGNNKATFLLCKKQQILNARYLFASFKLFFVELGAILSPFWKGNFKPHIFKHQTLLDVQIFPHDMTIALAKFVVQYRMLFSV